MNGRTYSLAEVESSFRDAMRAAGLATDDRIIADGMLHRFRVEGDKPGRKDGWYSLHADSIPAGVFGHWRTGVGGTWRADIGRTLTRTEQAADRSRIKAARAARDAEQARVHAAARARADRLWDAAETAGDAEADHPYLVRKGVGTHGLRQSRGLLIIPAMDTSRALKGLQFIAEDGTKQFLTGTEKRGAFFPIGNTARGTHAGEDEVLAIAEGFATAATIHECTGWLVACAFDAGNLEPVALALALATASTNRRIVICADNDRHTLGNPGITKGRAAAAAVGGLLVYPTFNEGDAGTDWNDFFRHYGRDATGAALRAVLGGES